MRIIDADELKKLRHDYIQGRIKFDGNEYDLIDKCPTIEARPVRHGRWIPMERSLGNPFVNSYKCSACDCKGRSTPHYCPNCGAIMDGGKKSEANY